MELTRICVLCWLALVPLVRGDVSSCKFTDESSGKTYDFSSLINPAGYYLLQHQVYTIGGFTWDTLVADDSQNITFYVQVCQNIRHPPSACKDPGAIYSITADGKCQSWGDATVAAFDPNPYNDGANLKMYHGTQIDHIQFNAGTIYFVCNSGYEDMAEVPMFEHVKAANNQAHFKFFTHLAC